MSEIEAANAIAPAVSQEPVPTPSAEPEPINKPGLDLTTLRLSQDFGASLGVKKAILTVPVRKPDRHWFVRTHPSPEYRFETAVIEDERELFLLDRPLWDDHVGEFAPMLLVTAINRQGVLFLWPIRLQGDDRRPNAWNTSSMDAAALAQRGWVRVAANMSLGAYEVFEASARLSEPEWPDLPFQEIVRLAFRDRFINSPDHTVLRRLRGEM